MTQKNSGTTGLSQCFQKKFLNGGPWNLDKFLTDHKVFGYLVMFEITDQFE